MKHLVSKLAVVQVNYFELQNFNEQDLFKLLIASVRLKEGEGGQFVPLMCTIITQKGGAVFLDHIQS